MDDRSISVSVRVRLVSAPVTSTGRRYEADDQCDCDCDCACVLEDSLPYLSLPLTYYLELTPNCNNQCPGCGNVFSAFRSVASPQLESCPLDASGWNDILKEIAPHAQRLKLTGGEPTQHPEFRTIVEYVADKGLDFTLFTNGRWDRPHQLINTLRELPQCLGLLISLHGATGQAHDAFTGITGSFEETCRNIRRASKAGLSVAISTVLTSHSVQQIKDIVALAAFLGASQVVFNRWIGHEDSLPKPTAQELRRAIHEIDFLRTGGQNVKFGSCIPHCFTLSSAKGCSAGTTFVTIDPWANVRPCNHAPLVVGNLQREPIRQIWHSPGMAYWRSLLPDQCGACAQFTSCHGGCRAMALLAGTDRDPLIRERIDCTRSVSWRPDELVLFEGARPRPCYTRREESFGPVLVTGNSVLPALPRYEPTLSALDGKMTLKEIAEQFGVENLAFVGELYRRRMIELQV